MRNKGVLTMGVACAVALVASACGGGDSGGGDSASGTVKVGVLSTLSGPASATFVASPDAVKARFAEYKASGGKCASTNFDVVTADDASSAQGALSGAQKLIQQDQVNSIIEVTPYFYGATPFLTGQGSDVPVYGGAWDGAQEWSETDNNLFPSGQVPNYDVIYGGAGQFLKSQGRHRRRVALLREPQRAEGSGGEPEVG